VDSSGPYVDREHLQECVAPMQQGYMVSCGAGWTLSGFCTLQMTSTVQTVSDR
jgi:hypothetical protein